MNGWIKVWTEDGLPNRTHTCSDWIMIHVRTCAARRRACPTDEAMLLSIEDRGSRIEGAEAHVVVGYARRRLLLLLSLQPTTIVLGHAPPPVFVVDGWGRVQLIVCVRF